MRAKKLINAIGLIDAQLITEYDEASESANRKAGSKTKANRTRRIWRNGAVAAASLVLATAIGLLTAHGLGILHLPIGGRAQSGGAGANAKSYMFYDGPIMPLTFTEEQNDLLVSRSTTYDFLPYTDKTEIYEVDTVDGTTMKEYTSHRTEALVTDSYLIENNSNLDVKAEAVYPVASSLRDLFEYTPQLLIDGSENSTDTKPDFVIGQYSGGFTSAWGAPKDQQDLELNIKEIDSWLGYKQLLSNGSYMDAAFTSDGYQDQEVVIYEFTNLELISGEGENPSLAVSYKASEDVKVLSYGFHGGSYPGGDQYVKGFSLPNEYRKEVFSDRFCLIVLGGDITDISYQGYGNMGWDQGTEVDIQADMIRSESTLESTFCELLSNHYEMYDSYYAVQIDEAKADGTLTEDGQAAADGFTISDEEQLELIFAAAYDYLHTFGALSDREIERYSEGMLEEIFSEAVNVDRVIYLTSEITVPANGTVNLTYALTQRGSHDFIDRDGSIPNSKGYDLTTSLGSNIHFTSQEASIADHGLIEITEQNFGFNLADDIRTVELDPAVEYYYMLVRKLQADD